MNKDTKQTLSFRPYGRVYAALLAAQAALSLLLLGGTNLPGIHAIWGVVLAAVLCLCFFGWAKRGLRVVARVLTGLSLLLLTAMVALLILVLVAGGNLTASLVDVCVLGGVALFYLTPAAGAVAAKGGGYDRFVACLCQVCLLGLAALATFHEEVCYTLLWTWDSTPVRVVWLLCCVATLLVVFRGALNGRQLPLPLKKKK